ncbi:uncharacterized protein LOC114946705 [Nylanderia fulva]|uniref:uncharacterized protein LOC114946705 n=1 Tax=Nylanderia fulva TaxID=613905 RepID=UPI0010FB23B3|nr:uncharacterized protein LOC114946705 [Nylanderia fulva]
MSSDKSFIDAIKESDLTCGVCISKVNKYKIFNHQCMKDWYSITINGDTKMFYPTNEQGQYFEKKCDEEQLVLLQDKSKSLSFDNKGIDERVVKSTDDCFIVEEDRQSILCLTTDKSILEEALIEEVRKRPPLLYIAFVCSWQIQTCRVMERNFLMLLMVVSVLKMLKRGGNHLKTRLVKQWLKEKNRVGQQDQIHKNHGNILKQCPFYVQFLQAESISLFTHVYNFILQLHF